MMKIVSSILFLAVVFFCDAAGHATTLTPPPGHVGISISSGISITEMSAVRFGNFTVSNPGDNGASIVLGPDGTRQAYKTATTQINLLTGGTPDFGAQGPGIYQVTGAGAGTVLTVSFRDHVGAPISSANPVVLTGPVGSAIFNVDTMTFGSPDTHTLTSVTADGSGNATILVGATLHTAARIGVVVITYAPGSYRGTFEVMVNY